MQDDDGAEYGYDDAAATFGDRLALCRDRQGLTQAQLARRLGLKVSTVQNWESDRSEPRANKLHMLAGFLNVSMTWLMTGEGEGGPTLGDGEGIASDLGVCLDEVRNIRLVQQRLTDRLARVEKRIRTLATEQREG